MKAQIFITIIILLVPAFYWSQDNDTKLDSLKIRKSTFGYRYYSNNTEIYQYQFRDIIKNDEDAFKLFRKGDNLNILSTAFGLGGGFGIGWLIGGMLAGGEPNWIMGGVGAGLLLFTTPLSRSAQNNLNKSVKVYNRNLSNQSGLLQKSDLSLTFNRQEIGFKLTF